MGTHAGAFISCSAHISFLGRASLRSVAKDDVRRRCVRAVRRLHHVSMSAGASDKGSEQGSGNNVPLSRSEQAKEAAKLYGGAYLGTSISFAIVSYATWYALVKAGVDVVGLIRALGDWLATTPVGRPAVLDRINETVGTAALAYIAHKASSPLRFPLTIAATPFVANALRGGKRASVETSSGGAAEMPAEE